MGKNNFGTRRLIEIFPGGGRGGANSLLVTRAKEREGEKMTIVKWSGYHKDDEINNFGGIERPALYLIL